MRSFFYPKLAFTNIRKNARTYIPYILSCIATIAMYYILSSLTRHSQVGLGTKHALLKLGTNVIAIFAIIFLYYTNSFLIKQRKKELGLYHLLGMEKKHIARIMIWEVLFTAFSSFLLGIISGVGLYKLVYLLMAMILKLPIQFGFELSLTAIKETSLLFAGIFLLTLLSNLIQIYMAKTIDLLKGGEFGEKEPKSKWLLALAGVITLAAGYYIAVVTTNPIEVILLFFVAVILVMIGTYLLFAFGSIVWLKFLRKQPGYYYQTKHFISISGMLYRMKQNAVGLANICILSTAVLVMLSSTLSLYIGMEDVLQARYKRDISVTIPEPTPQLIAEFEQLVSQTLKTSQVQAEDLIQYRFWQATMLKEKATFVKPQSDSSANIHLLYFIPLADYNQMMQTTETLEENEILFFSSKTPYTEPTAAVYQKTFTIKKQLATFPQIGEGAAAIWNNNYLIVKDEAVIADMMEYAKEVDNYFTFYQYRYSFNMDGNDEAQLALADHLSKQVGTLPLRYYSIESKAASVQDFFAIYGGLFFLGIFLGILFVLATILIIYYKQISEGYDDRARFEIMLKVGMDKAEIKRAIRSQIILVFFLPLLTAGIHIIFAFPVITRLLALLNLTNVNLFKWCLVGSYAVFSLFYAIVYKLTARTYYTIVSN